MSPRTRRQTLRGAAALLAAFAGCSGTSSDRSNDELASVVAAAHERAARLRAFDSLRERISNGEEFAVDEAADVIASREHAVSAVGTALEAERCPHLVRRGIDDLARSIPDADARFRNADRETSAYTVGRYAVEYVRIAATARAVPAASERVGRKLRSA